MTREVSDGLTEMQGRFVEEYIANGFRDAKGAALRAGASEQTSKDAYRNFLGSAPVKRAVEEAKRAYQEECRNELLGSAKVGILALRNVIADESAPHTAKVAAAKSLIELAGVGAPQRVEQTGVQEIIVRRVDREKQDDALSNG